MAWYRATATNEGRSILIGRKRELYSFAKSGFTNGCVEAARRMGMLRWCRTKAFWRKLWNDWLPCALEAGFCFVFEVRCFYLLPFL